MKLMNRMTAERASSYVIMALMLFVCGCNSSMIRMREMKPEDVRQCSVGVIILLPEKRIEFSEHLLHFITYELRENYYSFEGIWDPMPMIREACMGPLEEKFDSKPIPLWEALEQATYNDFVSTCEAAYNAARTPVGPDAINAVSSFTREWAEAPPKKYLQSCPETLPDALEQLPIDLVLEVSIHAFKFDRRGPFVIPGVLAFARLIRLSDGMVLWADDGSGVGKLIYHVKSFKDLEANDLALTKKHFAEAVTALFGQKSSLQYDRLFDELPTR